MGKLEREILRGSGYEEWMLRRENDHLDVVAPVYVEIINGENVVWANRSGVADGGYFNFYHIGCDHLGPVPRGQSEIKAMLECEAVQIFMFEHARAVANDKFQLDKILPSFTYVEEEEVLLDEEGEDIAARFVVDSLVRTITKPDIPQGNIRSGMHVKPIMQFMLGGISESQVDTVVDVLDIQGVVRRADPYISLAA